MIVIDYNSTKSAFKPLFSTQQSLYNSFYFGNVECTQNWSPKINNYAFVRFLERLVGNQGSHCDEGKLEGHVATMYTRGLDEHKSEGCVVMSTSRSRGVKSEF